MPGNLQRRPEVFCDLQRIANQMAARNADCALRFLDATEATFLFLQQNPHVGATLPHIRLEQLGLRVWRVKGFREILIFYRLDQDDVEIVRVLHGKQAWEEVMGEIGGE